MALPVEDAVVTLEAAVLAVAVVDGLIVAVVGLDVVDAGRDVEGAVAGLKKRKKGKLTWHTNTTEKEITTKQIVRC